MIKLDIIVHETEPEPVVVPPPKPKSKWRWPRRINMISKPSRPRRKYEPPPPETYKVFDKPLDPETAFRSDHLSRPLLRFIAVNKKMYSSNGPKYVKTMDKKITQGWNSIYNFYKQQIRRKKLNKLKRLNAKKKEKTKKEKEKDEERQKEFYTKLAKPKPIPKPPKIERKRKAIEDLAPTIDRLAEPHVHESPPPRPVPWRIARSALKYEITDNIRKMALPMVRKVPSVRQLGEVAESAKRAKCTPRLDALSKPSLSAREAKKQEDDKYDPWLISQNALKYKPTQRILELAKPMERD